MGGVGRVYVRSWRFESPSKSRRWREASPATRCLQDIDRRAGRCGLCRGPADGRQMQAKAGRAQTMVSLPHSGASHFNVCWNMPRTPKFGSGRSSTRTSRPFSQHAQIGRLSWSDSLAATACRSPRTLIVVILQNAPPRHGLSRKIKSTL
jgi:hypothetical protein